MTCDNLYEPLTSVESMFNQCKLLNLFLAQPII
jgi:hypothetical protein